MREHLRKRARQFAGNDTEWYCQAYYKAALRLRTEIKKKDAINQVRLWRHLQQLHDHIVELLQHDKQAERRIALAEQAIRQCMRDNHFDETNIIDFKKKA
jgi:hypothetical protein